MCQNCPFLSRCTRSKTHQKLVTRHVWENSKEWVRKNRLSERGKQLYKRRGETIELSFLTQRNFMVFVTYATGSLPKLRSNASFAVTQNIKKLALLLSKRGKSFVIWLIDKFIFLNLFISLKYTTPSPFLTERA
ncbi:transposase [Thermoactinomyces sp. CICC 10523]|nr:transposase [Thermoactinomyces sp. CICC 10523]